jgi:hypothetical protein
MEDSRYFFHEPKYCHDIRSGGVFDAVPWWKQIVNGVIHNEEKFLKFFCMLRVMFIKFALLFKDNLAFASNNKSSISTSVMSCTYLLHWNALAARTYVKDGLGIWKGPVLNYVDRAVSVINYFSKTSIFWLNATKWIEISSQIREEHLFPKVVGTVS